MPTACPGCGMEGLSPRVRGNRQYIPVPAAELRSIPACAGEPRSFARATSRRKVYPRVCGGTDMAIANLADMQGLSPRVRGNPDRAVAMMMPAGGLSPRVRGNRFQFGERGISPGSIPACAGEPCSLKTLFGMSRVYPRVCGGTIVTSRIKAPGSGLSPRVRGNRPYLAERPGDPGSIPACAGEPGRAYASHTISGVYPRVCGGTCDGAIIAARQCGLSPRVRGNPALLPGR